MKRGIIVSEASDESNQRSITCKMTREGGATELIVGPIHVSAGRNYTHALLG